MMKLEKRRQNEKKVVCYVRGVMAEEAGSMVEWLDGILPVSCGVRLHETKSFGTSVSIFVLMLLPSN